MTFHLTDTWRKGYNNLFDTLEHFILDFEEVEDNEVDEATKCTWLTATLKVSKEYKVTISNGTTTETTMCVLTGNFLTRLPWHIFLSMLKEEAKVMDGNKPQKSNSQCNNHQVGIEHGGRGHGGRGGRGSRGGSRDHGQCQGGGRKSNRVCSLPTK
jgi:uncharacterized membrane protein YgcG